MAGDRWSVIGRRRSVISSRWLPSRGHKRQPRVRELKLRGVDTMGAQTGAELLQRVARGDLCAAPFVHEPSDADAQLLPRGRALGFQSIEPRAVDGFERKPKLKALGRPRVHGCRCFERPPAPDRKSTRLNSSHLGISYAVFCLKKKKKM